MVFTLARIRLLLSSFLVVYVAYLFSYKCVQLKESTLEHGVQSVLHPLTHTHNQACDALNQGSEYLKPYVAQVQQLLDTHVHSHPLFKQYKVEAKLACAKGKYQTYLSPYVQQVFQLIEIIELRVYEYVVAAYTEAKRLYTQLTQ
ncbi:uncharacterized protein CANTADRAFT_5700 [Suhomyces tanzawaensis NRRL Y-17324]|uniref:Uncharacterized protein n=1 Tax=Suhomyces tanzawaensis NRRL Y-17324 TaxID=984487 RepID=A0A1E4SKI4_9ASCO|nr:uncharacterized protein CANTADRAFT_5700 [Suhomyces tanzawaensis NRRL Y-17324]ODV80025.1 hypothetical protein CANTADRAFT_5700 [Suhomyces tanzawaensis NRRL Y-17324]